jgi:dUTP pyrophosphatase
MTVKIIPFGGKMPSYAHINDAGADVYAKLEAPLTLAPMQTVKISCGIGVEIPVGCAGFVFPRSGLSAKGIIAQLPPIDPGYTGEIHAVLTNMTAEPYTVEPNDRVGQLIITPVLAPQFSVMFENDRRGDAFGSTGR